MFDHIAQPISYQHVELSFPVHLDIKRLDLVHPQISGNKFFKLKYNLLAAKEQGLSSILTFGGLTQIILLQQLMQLIFLV